MGFFSFTTGDTNEPIRNKFTKECKPVAMILPSNDRFIEEQYEGYGVFSGVDFYEALYNLNNIKTLGGDAARDKGIDMYFDEDLKGKLIMPRFSFNLKAKYDDLADPQNATCQGYF